MAPRQERNMVASVEERSDLTDQPKKTAPVIARLESVSKSYGPVKALDGLDLSIHAGELVALLGPNGAGKTTAVKLLLGLAKPSTGSVCIFGGNPVLPEARTRTGARRPAARVRETLRGREHIELFSSDY